MGCRGSHGHNWMHGHGGSDVQGMFCIPAPMAAFGAIVAFMFGAMIGVMVGKKQHMMRGGMMGGPMMRGGMMGGGMMGKGMWMKHGGMAAHHHHGHGGPCMCEEEEEPAEAETEAAEPKKK